MMPAIASRASLTRILYVVIGALVAGGIAFPAPANADEPFMVCPDGHTGVAEGHTSCPFAHDMRVAYESQPGPLYNVYSPVTDETYQMQCQGGFTADLIGGAQVDSVRCVGGNDAVVLLW